jgi:membrane associated rhomboid family serine protease
MFPFYPSRSLSHALILIMAVVSLIGFADARIIQVFGFHFDGLSLAHIPGLIASIISFQFLHGNLLHLALNGMFLYQAGPEVESRMSRRRFIQFFISATLFISLALALFSDALTIGMSGFCMALLSYLWIDLYTTRHPMANQILAMLVINILIGFSGNISFVGHFFGAVWGLVWWQFFRNWKR